MDCRALIVIGGSAGGVEALEKLVGALPQDLPAAVCIVLHIGHRRSLAPEILARAGRLPASHAIDGEPIRPGRIYVAPPDRHLIVTPEGLRLSLGPRENSTRPAVDPLFRSAAAVHGPRVIGVILSGMLSDGTIGFSEIKRRGGTTLVQDPDEARFPSMPYSALGTVTVDHCLPVAAIGKLLPALVGAMPATADSTASETEMSGMDGDYDLNAPVSLTCPGCGGALKETSVDSMPYFTCHIGHRYAADAMDESQFRMMEQACEVALRALNERATLCERLAETAHGKGQPLSVRRWEDAATEARERAGVLMRFLRQDWLRPPHESAGGPSEGSGDGTASEESGDEKVRARP